MKNWFTYAVLAYSLLMYVVIYFGLSLWIVGVVFFIDMVLCYLVSKGYIQYGYVYVYKLIRYFKSI